MPSPNHAHALRAEIASNESRHNTSVPITSQAALEFSSTGLNDEEQAVRYKQAWHRFQICSFHFPSIYEF